MDDRSFVIIATNKILPLSQTFIRGQAEAVPGYEPFYLGVRRVDGIAVPKSRSLVFNDGSPRGWFSEAVFRSFGSVMPSSLLSGLPDAALVHGHFGPNALMFRRVLKQLELPIVVTFHGVDATARKHLNDLRRSTWVKEAPALVIAVSDYIRERLLGVGFPSDLVIRHYIGIEVPTVPPPGLEERENTVLFVGRLVEKKGVEFVVRAAAELKRRGVAGQFKVVGSGPLREDLERLSEKLGARVEFLGALSPSQVHQEMARCKVFCAPSTVAPNGDAEGFGLVFLEAAVAGLPVVSFATGGVPEAVAHGLNGFLEADRDWLVLADRLEELLTNHGLWRSMSASGYDRVKRDFDRSRQGAFLAQLYDQII